MILPIAPFNFYYPSLNTLKTELESQQGSTIGQVSLITAPPVNIETAWLEVGAGNPDIGNDFGSRSIGAAEIGIITGPVLGPEEVAGENGYKLQFGIIPSVQIYIDGTGTSTATIIGVALIKGRDTLGDGSNDDVKYIQKIDDMLVTDGSLISLPAWELIINYATAP